MMEFIKIVGDIIANVLTALYQPFWFALLLSIMIMFFYMFCYKPTGSGRGCKKAVKVWIENFKEELFFRKLFLLVFFTVMILFRTLLNRNMWANPLSDVMGGWWIWSKSSDGTVTLTTECFENVLLMLPFTAILIWTAKEKLLRKIAFRNIVGKCIQTAFIFSVFIEFLQLFLRLGTFQLSDIFYNTLGGFLGGAIYWISWKLKTRYK